MNQIEKYYKDNNNSVDFIENYFIYLNKLMDKIDKYSISSFIDCILKARENNKTIYFCGNGGSAATCNHFANDLAIGTRTKGKPFNIISLSSNISVISAIANDFGHEYIFTKQLEAHLQTDDVVVGISASGNSKNIINAINLANDRNCTTVGITGFDGGKLIEISKLKLHVPSNSGEFGPVEDIHMIFDHVVACYLKLYCEEND